MIFEQEGDTLFALEKDAIYEGKVHDELMYCEIDVNAFVLRWEDDWKNVRCFTSLDEARNFAVSNYKQHRPYSNGRSYKI